jgi:uncharacterized protein (TIGR03435 family)
MFRASIVSALLLLPGCALAQSFEVASVKHVPLMDLRGRYKPVEGGAASKTPTRIGGHTTMMAMLRRAYAVKALQVSGPPWMATEIYEIAAVLPPGTTKEQEMVMWQNLLKERFQLQTHQESREVPVYALVVGKSGPKVKQSDPADEAAGKDAAAAGRPRPTVTMGPDGFPQIPADTKMPGSFTLSLARGGSLRVKMFGRHQTMTELADGLSGYAGRLVEDQTGLPGKYDFTLAFETESRLPQPAPDNQPVVPDERGVSLSTAVQEQLGLKLEAKKKTVEMRVIDRVEKMPAEN